MTLRDDQEAVFSSLIKQNNNVSVVSQSADFRTDNRICLTMMHLPDDQMKDRIIKEIIEPLQITDPQQYFYSKDALHMTIQNVKKIAEPTGFTKDDVRIVKELQMSKQELSFEVKGLLKSPSSIYIKAYPDYKTADFILSLRKKLADIGVPDDKNYVRPDIVISNITACRLYSEPNQKFNNVFNKISDIDLGTITVDRISLVTCNAVGEKREVVKEFLV